MNPPSLLLIDKERVIWSKIYGNVLYARSSDEAIQYLADVFEGKINPFDVTAFDHDLGGDDTAIPVLDYLEEKILVDGKPLPFKLAIIHSSDPAGALRLLQGLENMVPALQCGFTSLQSGAYLYK